MCYRPRFIIAAGTGDSPSANTVLLAGTMSVLGQPLGAGQGDNLTCRGEFPGESSLPFKQFAARLYVFHYNPGSSVIRRPYPR